MDKSLLNWYVVLAKPHQEHCVECNLRKLGIEVFCPRIKQCAFIRKSNCEMTAPLFPGYLFTRVSLAMQYRAVMYARGVRTLLSFGGTPAAVDDQIIDDIRARLHGGYIEIGRRVFEPGTLVTINGGPLQGFQAVFEREMSGPERAMVLLRTLAYQARVVLDVNDLVCA